jgi:SAM-dependent methyltransferase
MLESFYRTKDENIQREKARCKAGEYTAYAKKAWVSFAKLLKLSAVEIKQGALLLDAGCRDGGFHSFLAKKLSHVKYQGIDLIAHHVEYGKKQGRNCTAMDYCELKYPDATFDVVFSHHSLEHVWSPEQACRETLRVLKPGGLFFLAVPVNRKNLRGDVVGYLQSLGFSVLYNTTSFEPPPKDYKVLYAVARK